MTSFGGVVEVTSCDDFSPETTASDEDVDSNLATTFGIVLITGKFCLIVR